MFGEAIYWNNKNKDKLNPLIPEKQYNNLLEHIILKCEAADPVYCIRWKYFVHKVRIKIYGSCLKYFSLIEVQQTNMYRKCQK